MLLMTTRVCYCPFSFVSVDCNALGGNVLKVAVLLAAYNGEACIVHQLKSILGQVDVDVDVFVSVDESTDETLAIVSSFSTKNRNLHILPPRKRFGSAAKNFYHLIATVDTSTYDYVAFSDQDDIWFEDKLSFAIAEMRKFDAVGFSSNVIAFWPKQNIERVVDKASPQTKYDHWFESPGPGCSQVFTAATFAKFRAFVLSNRNQVNCIDYHDWLVYAFYRHNLLSWHISPVSKMKYIQHENNQIGANKGFRAVLSRLLMVRSRWYRSQINLIYRAVSGASSNLIGFSFMVQNVFKLRRKSKQSLAVFVLFVFGIL